MPLNKKQKKPLGAKNNSAGTPVQVVRGSSDIRQLRCTNKQCNNLVIQVPDGRGGKVHRCSVCGTTYAFQQF